LPTLGYIPQDRARDGLAPTLSVEDNLLFTAVQAPAFQFGPLLRRKALRRLAAKLIHDFDIRTPSASLPVAALSGGNQQKVVVARALYAHPDLIVAVNPTRGLDVGATRYVHQQLRSARQRGAAIVLISTDLDELAALADGGGILSGGRLAPCRFRRQNAMDLGLLLGGFAGEQRDAGGAQVAPIPTAADDPRGVRPESLEDRGTAGTPMATAADDPRCVQPQSPKDLGAACEPTVTAPGDPRGVYAESPGDARAAGTPVSTALDEPHQAGP
jgi:energy-coupling factor transporter ATP-binding protein EcfA2